MDPTRILDIASAFWSSAALLTATDLGLFGALDKSPCTAEEAAARLGLPVRPAAMLLDAMVALGLAQFDQGRYANTEESAAFLVPNKPGSLAGALGYNQRLFSAWGRLGDAVRADAPVVEAPTYLGTDPVRTRAFVEGMHSRALGMGHGLVGAVDLTGRKHLVDVGGGPGTLSVLLCRKNPELRATVLELPGIAAVGRELVAKQGMAERVVHRDADVFADDLGDGYDCALISGLFHREPAATCKEMLARLHARLAPGAPVYLVDVMRDATRIGPPFAALFALNMLLTSERGGCHADVDHAEWLEATGYTDVQITRPFPPMVHTIVRGSRSR